MNDMLCETTMGNIANNVRSTGDERADLMRAFEILSDQCSLARQQLGEIECGSLFKRWQAGHELAKQLRRTNDRFERFRRWFASGRTEQSADEAPDPSWPEELRFDDSDRAVIVRWAALQQGVQRLSNERDAVRLRLFVLTRNARQMPALPETGA